MIGLFGVITFTFSYWSLEGLWFHRIFNTDTIEFQTTQKIYHAGDKVSGTFTVCKHFSGIKPTIQWSLIDTYLRTYPARIGTGTLTGCVKDQVANIEILSDTLTPDTYYFSGTAVYQINPIKQIIVPLLSNKFEVK